MNGRSIRIRATVIALTFVFAFCASLSAAEDKGTASPKSPTTSHPTEKERSGGGPQEGIKVHGHWTVVIRNSDGSVASQSEFENSLAPEGVSLLNGCLTNSSQALIICRNVNTWQIQITLNSPNGTQLLSTPTTLTDPTSVLGGVTMSGSMKANQAGQIIAVESDFFYGTAFQMFTSRDLRQPVPPATAAPPPINVQAGQTIDAAVVISFS